jgi:hypothetical protein
VLRCLKDASMRNSTECDPDRCLPARTLFAGTATGRSCARRVWNLSAFGILTCIAALHCWSLLRFPAPFVDEAWIASRGWALLTRGEMIGSLDKGVADKFSSGWAVFPALPTLVHAAALAIAGVPSLLAVRLVSLVGGGVLAVAIWSIARRGRDGPTALLAVVLLTLSRPFVYGSHLARSDVLAAAMAYGGIALYLVEGPRRVWLAAVGGFLASLAIDMHPFAIVVAVALPVLAVAEFGVYFHKDAVARALLAGLCVGAAVWGGIHVYPDAHGYLVLTRVFYGPTHLPSSTSMWLSAPLGSLSLLLDAYLTGVPVAVWALASLGRSNRSGDRTLALLAATVFLAFSVVVRNKLHYYAILITPAFTLCIAAAMSRTFRERRTSPTLSLAWLTICVVLLVHSSGLSLASLRAGSSQAYERVQNRIALRVQPTDRIMASQTYWFGLHEHDYYSWEQLIYLQRFRSGSSMTDALITMRPDLFVRDGHMDGFILDSPGTTLYQRALRLPRAQLESWLSVHATIVDDFDGAVYGRIRIYRLHWAD